MIFYNDWLCLQHDSLLFNGHYDLSSIAHKKLNDISRFNSQQVFKNLGSKPVFCLSGGIDSQAAYQLLDKIYNFDVVIFEFANGLNSDEVNDAKRFANEYGIDYKVITKDVLRFLHFDLISFSKRFKISSPQFAVFAFFCEELKSLGYTGAIFSGNGFILEKENVTFALTKAQLLDLHNYGAKEFPIISNFLGFTQEMCLKISFNTPIIYQERTFQFVELNQRKEFMSLRYKNKIKTYENLGLYIIPQKEKKTGFEQLKEKVGQMYNDGWYFEKAFRKPLYNLHPNYNITTDIPKLLISEILDYSKKLAIS